MIEESLINLFKKRSCFDDVKSGDFHSKLLEMYSVDSFL